MKRSAEPTNDVLSRDMRMAIARNISSGRRAKGWSVRELAARSEASKSLIARLERAEANPSLEILWRVAGALEIAFSALIRDLSGEPALVRRAERQAFDTSHKGMHVDLIARIDSGNELYEQVMPPSVVSEWHSHGIGVREHVLVSSGRVTVMTAGKEYELGEGDFLAFAADTPHTYATTTEASTMLCFMRYGPTEALSSAPSEA